jgi:hypothetical protein
MPNAELYTLLASQTVFDKATKLGVLYFTENPKTTLAIVARAGGDGERYVQIVRETGEWVCSCEGSTKAVCSHLIRTLIEMEDRGRDVKSLVKVMLGLSQAPNKGIEEGQTPFLETDLKNFNSLVGGIPLNALFGIFGAHATNKSILSYQLAYSFFTNGSNALLIDTEGGSGEHALSPWIKAFNERYKLNVEIARIKYNWDFDRKVNDWSVDREIKKEKTYFFVADLRTIFKVLAFHGVQVHLEVSKATRPRDKKTGQLGDPEGGGQLAIRFLGPGSYEEDIRKTPIGQIVAKFGIKFVLIDSITNPVELFVSGQLNRPGRDDTQGLWFQQLQSLACDMGTTIIGTFHMTTDPTNQYDPYGKPVGGKAVGHNFKYILLTQVFRGAGGKDSRSLAAEKKNVRKLYLLRHPRKPPLSERTTISLTDFGFIDTDVEIPDIGEGMN